MDGVEMALLDRFLDPIGTRIHFLFPEASANILTLAVLDPVSKIPSFKICAVKVEAV